MVTTLRATFDGKVLVPEGPVDLPRDTPLEVDVRPAVNQPALPAQTTALQDLAAKLISLDVGRDAPNDLAAQHDHYLYGTPKRANP